MGTKEDLISEQAEYIYREIGEGYGFDGPEDLALAIIQDKLDEYADEVSTSQKETIERLENLVKAYKSIKTPQQ